MIDLVIIEANIVLFFEFTKNIAHFDTAYRKIEKLNYQDSIHF